MLPELDTTPYELYSHQNEDIVCESPAQLKARMAAKEAARQQAGTRACGARCEAGCGS